MVALLQGGLIVRPMCHIIAIWARIWDGVFGTVYFVNIVYLVIGLCILDLDLCVWY